MNTNDFEQFSEIVTAAADAVGRPAPGKNAMMLLFGTLQAYSLEQIKAAYMAHFRSPEGRYWPTPAHIVEQIEGKPEDIAAAAWALVARLLDNGGSYKSVRFPFPAYHYAIEQMGGWIELGDKYDDCNTREAMFLAKEFKQFYLMAGRAGVSWETEQPYLVGIYEDEKSPRPMGKKVLIVETGEFIPREQLTGKPESISVGAELAAGKRI